jgi:integrase
MAKWNDKRGCFRAVVDVGRAGEKRQRKVLDIREPNTKAGQRAANLAEAKFRVELAEALDNEWPGLGRTDDQTTFAATAWSWVERSAAHWSPKTLKETRYSLKRYVLPSLGSTPLGKVSPIQIEETYGKWAAAGFSAVARRRWHGMVRSIFADAERLGELAGPNPMTRVRPAGGKAPERRIPSPDEVRLAIASAQSPLAAAYFALAVSTGARRGTLVALRWRDVDFESNTVSYVQAVALGCDGPVLKTNKAERAYAVSIVGTVVQTLAEQRRHAAETAMALGIPGDLDELFVFSRDGGLTHWNLTSVSRAWRVACERAGVAPCRLHDIRHFAATRLLAAGVPVRVVADRLGCTEANVIRTYSHRVPTPEDARAAEVLAAALEG